MPVIRVEKTKNYTVMSNYHLKEKNMSLKAKGLLSVMLSLPDNWDYTIAGLSAICKENETAIKSALKELQNFGYLHIVKKLPNQTKSGRIEYEYIVYETPKQEGEKQGVENLGVEFLGVENQRQLNTNKLNTNNKILNNKNKYPSLEEIEIYIKDKQLKVNGKQFYDYFTEGNWVDSKGNKVKNWKQKLLTWNKYSIKEAKINNNFEQREYNDLSFLYSNK